MTAMSRKFYQRLAAEFKRQKPNQFAPSYDMWITMVFASANVITEGNPAFDLNRFLIAAGVPESVVAGD